MRPDSCARSTSRAAGALGCESAAIDRTASQSTPSGPGDLNCHDVVRVPTRYGAQGDRRARAASRAPRHGLRLRRAGSGSEVALPDERGSDLLPRRVGRDGTRSPGADTARFGFTTATVAPFRRVGREERLAQEGLNRCCRSPARLRSARRLPGGSFMARRPAAADLRSREGGTSSSARSASTRTTFELPSGE